MSSKLTEQIYQNMNLKDTEELLAIWQKNDRNEWSETAFEVIQEILKERIDTLPPQNEPFSESAKNEAKDETHRFSEEELAIIDDENPPEFYDPFEVLTISNWLEWAAKIMVIFSIILNLVQIFPLLKGIVESYFWANPNPTLVIIITLVLVSINIIVSVAIYYFLLITLARVLKILMQMEFNSRPKQS